VLQLKDDGVGMRTGCARTGAGLVGMRERIETLGGAFEARNGQPHGFRITATLPFPAQVA
jgi:signal transduction histidine kinase